MDPVIPAQAGIQDLKMLAGPLVTFRLAQLAMVFWIPAYAGVTKSGSFAVRHEP